MAETGRVITANLPNDLFVQLDDVAHHIDRSKSWIVKEALTDWLAEWRRRHELTLEALNDVDEGRTFSHEEVLAHFEQRRRKRR
jgi:predicted transcriptional regulator